MRTIWNEQRLQRLFWRYNRRFFGDALKGWTVDTDELHQVCVLKIEPTLKISDLRTVAFLLNPSRRLYR
jgi:hypothetical protein